MKLDVFAVQKKTNIQHQCNIVINIFYFETNVSDRSFIEEQRFEAIIASLSSDGGYDGFETLFFNKTFIAYVCLEIYFKKFVDKYFLYTI